MIVIVRIMGEGQFEVADADLDVLNALDRELEAAVEAGDEAEFAARCATLLDAVRHARQAGARRRAGPVGARPARRRRRASTRCGRMLGDEGLIPG